jgi:hypothetical protein
MKNQMKQTIDLKCRFETKAGEEPGFFHGYGSVFGNLDGWDDIVHPGAFKNSLAARKPAMLWQHCGNEPIGTWEHIQEDETGLAVTGKLLVGKVARATEAYELLKANALEGLSIGYMPVKWEYEERDDVLIRHLKEVDLWEISLVTFPANEHAIVSGVKSLEEVDSLRDLERYLRDAGHSRKDAEAILSLSKKFRRDAEEEKALCDMVKQTIQYLKG